MPQVPQSTKHAASASFTFPGELGEKKLSVDDNDILKGNKLKGKTPCASPKKANENLNQNPTNEPPTPP